MEDPPARSCFGLAGFRCAGGCRRERQKVCHVQDPQYLSLDGANAGAALIVKQARGPYLNDLAAGAELAAARGQDILNPVAIWAICQGDDLAIAGAEHIDRCLVGPTGPTATVNDHAEARHPGRDVPRDAVQPGLIPSSDHLRYRHAGAFLLRYPAALRSSIPPASITRCQRPCLSPRILDTPWSWPTGSARLEWAGSRTH